MASIAFLNYFAFVSLYIIGFVFFYQKFSEVIGFALLIVVNTAFLFYLMNDIMSIFEKTSTFVPMISCFAVIVGLVFHTVVLIFILMMSTNLQAKYSKKYGSHLELPKKYADMMETVKQLMIISFCLGFIILYILFYYNESINRNFSMLIKHLDLKLISENKLIFVTLSASLALMGISSKQVYDGNLFSKLSRQQLMDK